MITRILCPLDGSLLSDEILVQVKRILRRSDAEVRLLRVLPEPGILATETWQEEVRQAHLHMDRLREKLTTEGVRVHSEFASGTDPAAEILKVAMGWSPSLVAMSTHGRTGVERFVRGSVCERVLQGSTFPVLALNPHAATKAATGDPEQRFKRILVAMDGSDRAAAILPLVLEIARNYTSSVLLYYVAPMPQAPGVDPLLLKRYTAQEALPVLEGYRATLAKAGLRAESATSAGDPADEILRASEAGGCDLIAMTTHGRSGISRWTYGSVAEKVLRQIRYPILLLRSGA